MAQQPEQKQKETRALLSPGADYSLLLNRLEKTVLHDQEPGQALKVLQEKKIWQKLNGQHLLQWASLAQVAGAIDTALEVYEHLTVSEPELKQGWLEYLDLISLLDKKELLASRVARAAAHVSKEALDRWHQQIRQNNARENSSRDLDNIEAPFQEMIWQREAMGRFMTLFSGREDVFARQWVDKNEGKSGYVPVRRVMCLQDVEDHLLGRKTYGIYLLNRDNKVRCGVIDVDIVSRFRTGKIAAQDRRVLQREKNYLESRIYQMCRDLGISPLMEFSGNKGFHFWFLFERPVAAEKVKSLLQQMAQPLNKDLTAFDLEVFPKQDQLKGKGLGNLVKLPLGIHRFSGKPSFFPACEKRDMASQLHHLQGIPLISTDVLKEAARMDNAARIVMHPRIAKTAAEYPELFELEQRCPPMGQILAACRQGRSCTAREEKILLQTIPAKDLEKLILSGYVSMSGSVMNFLISNRVETVFVTPTGKFRARLMIDEHKHVALRKAQYLKLSQDVFGQRIMKVLVKGKLDNMAALLLRRASDYNDGTLRNAAIGLKTLAKKLETEISRDAIRGIEGAGSRIYFSVFQRLIRNEAFTFRGRNRRPPLDPVNALLSFVYTLLTNEVLSAIKTVGMDPYLGTLHEVSYGRPSLACDLVEEYRSIVADRLVLKLINQKMVKPNDFAYRENCPAAFVDETEMKQKRPVEMKPYLLKAFLAAYEGMMGGKRNYRQTLRNQVRQFADFLLAPDKGYHPLKF